MLSAGRIAINKRLPASGVPIADVDDENVRFDFIQQMHELIAIATAESAKLMMPLAISRRPGETERYSN
jgi:hypothetical protein